MIGVSDTCSCTSQSKCKRATASSASSRNLSLPILSTFAAAAFAVAVLAGAFMAMPAQAQPSPSSFSTVYNFDYNPSQNVFGAENPGGNLVKDSKGDLFGVSEYGHGDNCTECNEADGTVYELIPKSGGGYTETVLFSFPPYSIPSGGLVVDTTGDLFGVISNYGYGSIFEVPYDTTTGKYDVETVDLYNFTDCTDSSNCDGFLPSGQLVIDSNGDLFGTTAFGGKYEYGTVYELPYDSTSQKYDQPLDTLYSFTGNEGYDPTPPPPPYDSEYPEGGLVMDSSGNLFGTSGGYPDGNGAIFELTKSSGYSTFNVLHAFINADAYGPVAGLIVDGNGNLFGTTLAGGANDSGVIFELPYDSTNKDYDQSLQILYSFAGDSSEGFWPLTSLVIDGSGNLYGTAAYGGTSTSTACTSSTPGCGTVFELPYDSTTSSYDLPLNIIHQFTAGDDGANPALGGLLLDTTTGNIFGTAMGGGNTDCQNYTAYVDDFFFDTSLPGCGTVFEFSAATTVALNFEYAKVRIIEGASLSQSGFQLQADVTPTDTSTFDPLSQPVTLSVGSYSVTIPGGSFHQLTHGRNVNAWVYTGTIGGVTLSVQIDPLDGDGDYEFKANASGVQLPPDLTSINVFIQVGDNAGTTTVTPSY